MGYIITGTSMRYSGDDFCYGGILTQYGFWKAQWVSYWQVMPYHGNRYALTLLSDISNTIGPLSSAVLPGLAITSFVSGIIFILYQLRSLAKLPFTIWEMVLYALLIVYFSIYQAPNLAQSLYWRSGMLPYFAPLIFNTFVVGIILKGIREQSVSKGTYLIVIILSFLGGGFSETATALQIGFLCLLLLGLWLWGRGKNDRGISIGIKLGLTALITAGLALILLAFSPSIVERLAKVNHPDLFTFLLISVRSALSFSFQSLMGQPVPTVINFLIFSSLSYLFYSRLELPAHFSGVEYLKSYALVILAGLMLIVCITAPSAYAQSAYPELRALFMARFIMVAGISVSGFITGRFVIHWLQSRHRQPFWLTVGILIFTGVLLIYPVYTSRYTYSKIPDYQRWARFWDERDREIQKAKDAGIMDLEVIEIDHIIPGVGDLYPSPKHWHNVCASAYYGVNSISANQPGWDD
jgi:hypothetical protein